MFTNNNIGARFAICTRTSQFETHTSNYVELVDALLLNEMHDLFKVKTTPNIRVGMKNREILSQTYHGRIVCMYTILIIHTVAQEKQSHYQAL